MEIESESSDAIADLIYFSPVLEKNFTENPFKAESRIYPVDFVIPQSYSYVVSLQLPDNYQVDEMPEPIALNLLDNKAYYTYTVAQEGNRIQILVKLNVKNTMFLPHEYTYLKDFFNQIISKEEEQIVLKKISSSK